MGPGFYTTTNRSQAISFAHKVMSRNDSQTEIVSMYEINFHKMKIEIDVLEFDKPNEE